MLQIRKIYFKNYIRPKIGLYYIIGSLSAFIGIMQQMFGGRRHANLKSRLFLAKTHSAQLRELMQGTALVWSQVENLSNEDSTNMEALEELMCEVWLSTQELEITAQIQDEGDEFFNSIDPFFWAP